MQYGIQHHVEIAAKAAGAVIFNQHRKVLLVQELHGTKRGYGIFLLAVSK